MTERVLAEYVDAFVRAEVIPWHREGVPVLIRYGADGGEDGDGRAFRTAFGRVENTSPTGLDELPDANRTMTTVYVIAKKEGAPFPEQIGIGRAANTDVCLSLPKISKYHASLFVEPGGTFACADAGSKNGTWLNAQRLAPREKTPLPDGSRLRLGPHKFVFHTYDGLIRLLRERALERSPFDRRVRL